MTQEAAGSGAIDQLEPVHGGERPTRQAWLIAVSAGLGYAFDAYVVNIYTFVLPLIAVTYALGTTAQGVVGSILLLGYAIGTFGFGWAADRFGRKNTLGVSILLYGVTTAISGLMPNAVSFSVFRFFTGTGGAGELSVGVPYTVEAWPPRRRSTGAGGVVFSLFAVGALLAIAVAVGLGSTIGWRWTFIFALVPALGVFWLRRRLSESVPFLRARERHEAAAGPSASRWTQVGEILGDRGLRRRLLVVALIFIGNAVGYWGFLVFLQKYITGTFKLTLDVSLGYTAIFYVAMLIWPFVGARVSDRIGRRPAGIGGAIVLAIASIIAFSTHSLAIFVIAQVFGIGLLGWMWSVGETYASELFPTRLRATGFGFGVSIGRVPAIAGPLVTGVMADQIGIGNVAKWFALIWVFLIVGYLIGPETKGKSLAELDAIDPRAAG